VLGRADTTRVVSAPSSESVKVVPTAIITAVSPIETTNCDPWPCGFPETENLPELTCKLHPDPTQFSPSKTSVTLASLALPCLLLLPYDRKFRFASGAAQASQSQSGANAALVLEKRRTTKAKAVMVLEEGIMCGLRWLKWLWV
jgi:hypothetical protein